jgi:CoA:oxalate CoA-transferase
MNRSTINLGRSAPQGRQVPPRPVDRTSQGRPPERPLDISMLSCQLALLENAYARFLNSKEVPAPLGSRHPSIAPFESYSAADSDLVVGLGTNADWPRFCQAIEAPQLMEDPRFRTTPLRLEYRDELEVEINRLLKAKPRRYWLERLQHASIVSGPKVTIREFAQSEFATVTNAFEKVHIEEGELGFVRHPLSEPNPRAPLAAPRLGEHTAELLEKIGYSLSETADLKARGIVVYP